MNEDRVGANHDRATLQGFRINLLEHEKRRLRLALRTVLPHAPMDARRYAEAVLEETS